MIYEFRCDDCDEQWDEFQKMTDQHDSSCPTCNKTVHRLYTATPHTVDFKAGFDESLGEYVDTKRQRDEILRENNLRRVKAYG